VTQEFLLSVTPVEGDKYLIRTEHERMSTGVPVAQEIVTWQVESWIAEAAKLMDDPLLGLLRSGNGSPDRPSSAEGGNSNLVLLGQQLYQSLFQATIRDSWIAAQGIAQNKQDILRLRLGLQDDRVSRLPWEVMNSGDRPLATGTDVVFSRYHIGGTPAYLSGGIAGQPLRILMVLSAPTDQEQLQLHEEAAHLREELASDRPSHQGPEIELTILDQPGREQLTQDLEQGNYDIFHYAGHSGWGVGGGDLYLVNSRTGLTEALSGEDLAGLLVNNGVRMAVLNSCRGGHAATSQGSSLDNLADALLRRGVPAILAMAERIPDDVALNLSRLFYRNLKQGYPIDLSLNRARQGLISSYGSQQLYWALPILYLHPEFDGYLHRAANIRAANIDSQSAMDALIDPIDVLDDPLLMDFESLPMDDFEGMLDLSQDSDYSDDRAAIADLMQGLDPVEFPDADSSPVVAKSPVEDLLVLGRNLQTSGDLTGAIDAYGQALKLDGQNAVVYDSLGTALQQYGNLPEALSAYRMANQLDPQLESAKLHLDALRQGIPLQGEMTIAESPAKAAIFGSETSKATPAAEASWKKPASVAIAALAAIGLGFGAMNLSSQPKSSPFGTTTESGQPAEKKGNSRELITIATEALNQQNPRPAQDAIESLLNQGAIVEADTALNVVTAKQMKIPGISYLRGRTSWQLAQQGNQNHSYQDARRAWGMATQADPNNLAYQNALGWAYYVEKDYPRASDAWTQVRKLTKDSQNISEVAIADAGLALSYFQLSKTDRKDEKKFRAEAVKLRDRVLKARPQEFTDEALSKNWLWTEQMIADWKALRSVS
jgi:tetratricopeptide (TPR) repeat protein